jgi:hypothetical protein
MNVMLSIVLRVLWNGGVTRIAVEEARRIHSKLLVLRESKNDYDLGEVNFEVMRKYGERSSFTPLLTYLTALYAKDRGTEATVDLDLILKAIKRIKPPALYHDQFSGIIGYIRKNYTVRTTSCIFMRRPLTKTLQNIVQSGRLLHI